MGERWPTREELEAAKSIGVITDHDDADDSIRYLARYCLHLLDERGRDMDLLAENMPECYDDDRCHGDCAGCKAAKVVQARLDVWRRQRIAECPNGHGPNPTASCDRCGFVWMTRLDEYGHSVPASLMAADPVVRKALDDRAEFMAPHLDEIHVDVKRPINWPSAENDDSGPSLVDLARRAGRNMEAAGERMREQLHMLTEATDEDLIPNCPDGRALFSTSEPKPLALDDLRAMKDRHVEYSGGDLSDHAWIVGPAGAELLRRVEDENGDLAWMSGRVLGLPVGVRPDIADATIYLMPIPEDDEQACLFH